MHIVPYEVMQQSQWLVYRSCDTLNNEIWKEFLDLCEAETFRYRILTYSPEIRREQCWADRDFNTMKSSFDLLHRHNSDHSKLTRQAVVQHVAYNEAAREVAVRSSLAIYRTQMDGTMSYLESGQSALYAIGTYVDRIRIENDTPLLLERVVNLDTRQLDVGSHKPF
ncbi:MAG TPA: methanesulfonate monooxygenase [Burkholderiaceae bacterium]|jgi:methanesulfonate monooxygenase small subunit|nr:methanesulfonate monooxygenase [Burkholderiaceae bacterium]